MPTATAPPSSDPLTALAERCVQCGLCLPHCPTYRLTGAEPESPRGRIAIARGMALGLLPGDAESDAPLDHCLSCARCETVCPAHVPYTTILLESRRRQRQRRGASLRQHALEWLTSHPGLLADLLRSARLLRPLLRAPARQLLPPPRRPRTAPATTSGTTVAIFRGCVARAYDDELDAGLDRLLRASGLNPLRPSGQTCCGALHVHAGNARDAQILAQCNRSAFAGTGTVLTTASGCHATLSAELGSGVRVRDALTVLAEHAQTLRFHAATAPVALHIPCTQARSADSEAALRLLLARIPNLNLTTLTGLGCCGAAGTHMLNQPQRAARLRQPLLDGASAAGARIILSANIGCRLHLTAGSDLEVIHPIVFLARHLS